MTLLKLIRSLDERGIGIEVRPSFVKSATHAPTMEDAEAAKPFRTDLIRVALARSYMAQVLDLEKTWAGYPSRRTPELERQVDHLKAQVLYLLPDGLPLDVVEIKRPDGTTVELEGVA